MCAAGAGPTLPLLKHILLLSAPVASDQVKSLAPLFGYVASRRNIVTL